MRSGSSTPISSTHGRLGAGAMTPSPVNGIHVASSTAAVSRTEWETTCCTDTPHSSRSGPMEPRPRDGLRPTRPHMAAGMRIEPPPSEALAHGHHPGGDGGRRSAAGATGAVIRVPGVVGRAVGQRLGRGHQAELGRVGPAEDDEARLPVALREVGVLGVDVARLLERLDAHVERVTGGGRPQVLQQEGHAPERAVGQVGGRRLLAGPVEALVDDGVELRVQGLDAGDGGVDQLERRRLAAADQVGLGHGVEAGEVIGHAPDRRPPGTHEASAHQITVDGLLTPCQFEGRNRPWAAHRWSSPPTGMT